MVNEALGEGQEFGRQGTKPRDHDLSPGGTAQALEATDDLGWMTAF